MYLTFSLFAANIRRILLLVLNSRPQNHNVRVQRCQDAKSGPSPLLALTLAARALQRGAGLIDLDLVGHFSSPHSLLFQYQITFNADSASLSRPL